MNLSKGRTVRVAHSPQFLTRISCPGQLGTVTDYFLRVVHQTRCGLHVSMILWVTKDEHGNTMLSKDDIPAEMLRIKLEDGTEDPCNETFSLIV